MNEPLTAIVRIPAALWDELEPLLCRRYPREEWASFLSFGWTFVGDTLLLTVAGLIPPGPKDMDESVGIVQIFEPYSLRVVLEAEQERLGLGIVHSHPEDCRPWSSVIDDDMDSYYREYFGNFLDCRPYLSLIYSRSDDGRRCFSGRIWLGDRQYRVEQVVVVGKELRRTHCGQAPPGPSEALLARTARSTSAYGTESIERLWWSRVGIVGVGGTGPAAAHVLARAGVGHITLVDTDSLAPSNLERLHGSEASLGDELKVNLVAKLSEAERDQRRAEAKDAEKRGIPANQYWRDVPQLLTVGHLTTAAGAIVATYAVGMLTGRFGMPASFYQADLLADGLGYVSVELDPKPSCACSERVGWADQGADRAAIAPPAHWPQARVHPTAG